MPKKKPAIAEIQQPKPITLAEYPPVSSQAPLFDNVALSQQFLGLSNPASNRIVNLKTFTGKYFKISYIRYDYIIDPHTTLVTVNTFVLYDSSGNSYTNYINTPGGAVYSVENQLQVPLIFKDSVSLIVAAMDLSDIAVVNLIGVLTNQP